MFKAGALSAQLRSKRALWMSNSHVRKLKAPCQKESNCDCSSENKREKWGREMRNIYHTSHTKSSRSGSAHCDLALAAQVRQCPLRSGADEEGEEEKEAAVGSQAALIKSNNPRLASGDNIFNFWHWHARLLLPIEQMLKSTLDAQHNLWSKQTDLKAPALNSRGDPSGNLFVQRREKECPAARSILKEAWQTWMEVQTASKLARQDLLMVIWSPFSQNIRLEASDLNTNSHVQKKRSKRALWMSNSLLPTPSVDVLRCARWRHEIYIYMQNVANSQKKKAFELCSSQINTCCAMTSWQFFLSHHCFKTENLECWHVSSLKVLKLQATGTWKRCGKAYKMSCDCSGNEVGRSDSNWNATKMPQLHPDPTFFH